jgi:hypothetical protein
MTFVHPLLLGGLLLVGIPVLLHLIVRQKPKHLLFPAFQLLRQRHRKNQRKLRWRHLLLLALRMGLIVAICLALARPEVFSERLRLYSDRPVAAVLVFDTSYSMQYTVEDAAGSHSRLSEAQRLALELLNELPEDSRVAILDTAKEGGGWADSIDDARDKIKGLELSYASGPVTDQVEQAYALFANIDKDQGKGKEALPRFLYVFSDRTIACWDPNRLRDLQRRHDELGTEVKSVFVDVGVEKPEDLAIAKLELPHQVVPSNGEVEIHATVQATGRDYPKGLITCRIDGQDKAEQRPLNVPAGATKEVVFTYHGGEAADLLKPGPHQVELQLKATDTLPFTKVRFATFEFLHGARRVLIVSDHPRDAAPWKFALEAPGPFHCEVPDVQKTEWLDTQSVDHLRARYQVICLFNVGRPGSALWTKLYEYVRKGGGLAVMPGGDKELDLAAYNEDRKAKQLLPGRLEAFATAKGALGAPWNWTEKAYEHPAMKPFREWNSDPRTDWIRYPCGAKRYWKVKPYDKNDEGNSVVIVSYAGENQPALLERTFVDKDKAHGHVLLFTTPLDGRTDKDGRPLWNNYIATLTTFYVALAQVTAGYLAGDVKDASFNHPTTGHELLVPLPLTSPDAQFTLCRSNRPRGPGISGVEVKGTVTRQEGQAKLESNQTVLPGNYTLAGADNNPVTCFSLNPPPQECELGRVPVEEIEALFGAGAVLKLDKGDSLRDALQGPVRLLPWLMVLVVLLLAVESLVANKFYRREAS